MTGVSSLDLLEKEAQKRPSRWPWTVTRISVAALLRPAHMSTYRESHLFKIPMMETPSTEMTDFVA